MSTPHTFPVFASAPWTVKLLYKSTCVNHFQTHFFSYSFYSIKEKAHKRAALFPHCAPSNFLPTSHFVSLRPPGPTLAHSHLPPPCLTFVSLFPVSSLSLSHMYPHSSEGQPVPAGEFH